VGDWAKKSPKRYWNNNLLENLNVYNFPNLPDKLDHGEKLVERDRDEIKGLVSAHISLRYYISDGRL